MNETEKGKPPASNRMRAASFVDKPNCVHQPRHIAPVALVVLTLNVLWRRASGGQDFHPCTLTRAMPRTPFRCGEGLDQYAVDIACVSSAIAPATSALLGEALSITVCRLLIADWIFW